MSCLRWKGDGLAWETQSYKPAHQIIRKWSFILAMQSKSNETMTELIVIYLNI